MCIYGHLSTQEHFSWRFSLQTYFRWKDNKHRSGVIHERVWIRISNWEAEGRRKENGRSWGEKGRECRAENRGRVGEGYGGWIWERSYWTASCKIDGNKEA